LPDLYFSVSQLDRFREWEESEDEDLSDLISALTGFTETPDTRPGKAFHRALETMIPFAEAQNLEEIKADGFTFVFRGDFDLPLVPMVEVKAYKTYGNLRIGCRCDGLSGTHIIDHKASTWFHAERYMKKYAWRYYLDIFKATSFTWHIWEMKETDDPGVWWVEEQHVLEQFRYPNLTLDCTELARRMSEFAAQHPEVATRKVA